MSRKLAGWLTLLAVLGGTVGWYATPRPGSDSGHEERMSLGQAFGRGIDLTGFAQVEQPREFRFPDDHGPHPDYRTEWWYYTGNLRSADGRRFGFQLTFFRSALRAPAQRPERASAWAAEQVYMAHFAVSDMAAGGFHAFERFSRGALGLAGAQAVPFRVWLEDWSVAAADRGASGRQPTLRLRAAQDDVSLDLTLRAIKPVVAHGERGLSRKDARHASYYYSLTRLRSSGVLRVGDREFAVDGLSWMDREWSTGVLGGDVQGWDWFSMQLSDGQEVMLYRMRPADAAPANRLGGGTLVSAQGVAHAPAAREDAGGTPALPGVPAETVAYALAADDFRIDVLDTWPSPRDSTPYPAEWRIRIPRHAVDVIVTPLLADQEMDTLIRYWEGAVGVQGRVAGRRVTGHGYVELTGYAEAADGAVGGRFGQR